MQPARPQDRRPDADRAGAWLAGAGLRPTRQRLALAELLIGDGRNRHVTAEGLHEAALPSTARRSRSPPSTTRCAPSARPA